MTDLFYDKNFLIIDDDQAIIELVTSILEKHGIKVHGATNAKIGMAIAETSELDMIILDHHMAEATGDEVLYSLKEGDETKNIPVVVLTGEKEESVAHSYLKLGAAGYVIKPFQPNDFMELIREVLEKSAAA